MGRLGTTPTLDDDKLEKLRLQLRDISEDARIEKEKHRDETERGPAVVAVPTEVPVHMKKPLHSVEELSEVDVTHGEFDVHDDTQTTGFGRNAMLYAALAAFVIFEIVNYQ